MTPEAALAKLSYILSKKEWSLATKKEMMQTSLRGELTVVKETALKDLDLITAIAKTMNISSTEELEALKTTLVPSILCNVAAKGDCERLEVMRQFVSIPLEAHSPICAFIHQSLTIFRKRDCSL